MAFFISLSLYINYFWYYDFIYKDHLFQWVPLSNFCRPSQAEIEVSRIQGWSKIHKQFLYSESRKVRNKRLKGKCFIFNNIFNIFWQLQWYKLILLIAIYCNCTWSRTARLLTTNNPRYSDNDTFSASSVVTFNGLFCNMSSITEIYLFWGRGGGFRLPSLWLKASTPLTYFAEGQRTPFKILYWRKLCFLIYYLHSLHDSVFIKSKFTFIHSLAWIPLTFFNSSLVSWISINSFLNNP